MKQISRTKLETVSGGLFQVGLAINGGSIFAVVDLGLVFHIPFVGSFHFGNTVRIMRRLF